MVVATKNPPAVKRAGKIAPIKVKAAGPCRIAHAINGRNMMQADLSLAAFWETIAEMKADSATWTPGRHKFTLEIDYRPGGTVRAPTKKP